MEGVISLFIHCMLGCFPTVVSGHLHTDAISYLEPIHYDRDFIYHQHRERRSTGEPVHLQFKAFSREWSIKLTRNRQLFDDSIVIETSQGAVVYDFDSAYTGTVEGEQSHVFGTITTTGHFEGQLKTRNDTFIIEKSRKHNFISDADFHSVIYNVKHVTMPDRTRFCGISDTFIKLKSPDSEIKENNVDNDFKLRYTSDNHDNHERYRRAVDPLKTVCHLYIQVDHKLFFKFHNSTDDMIGYINNHVMAVNTMYNPVDFDSNSSPDNIGFTIKRIKIYNDPTVVGYKYSGNLGVVAMLNLHSEDNYDSFCLSYIFTYRDFDNGILGLAWTAEPDTNGGLCSKYTLYTDGYKSLNTGLVTFLNYGTDVVTAVSYVTFAHEIGHNFGALHDDASNPTCTPGEPNGNYIMFAQATSGTKTNNKKFSSCSISTMATMIAERGRDTSVGCFKAYSSSICGNNVVESGEQCDCGWDNECSDTCCYPSLSAGGPDAAKACQLKPTATCSPSQGQCCSPTSCKPYLTADNVVCRTNTSCMDKAACNGGLTCPVSTASANGTICGNEQVCFLGQCSGQVCQAHGYQQCQCAAVTSGDWKDPLLCTLCCTDHNDGNKCKKADVLFTVPFSKAVPGTPCNNFLGYCDVFHICREVNPTGPLSDLKNFLLGGELINKVKNFLTEYWYVAVAGGVGIIILLVLLVKCCSKSTKKKVEPAPRQVTVEPWERY